MDSNNNNPILKDVNLNNTALYYGELEEGQIIDSASLGFLQNSTTDFGNSAYNMPSHTNTSGSLDKHAKEVLLQSDFNPDLHDPRLAKASDSRLFPRGNEVQDIFSNKHQNPMSHMRPGGDCLQSDKLNSIGFNSTNIQASKKLLKKQRDLQRSKEPLNEPQVYQQTGSGLVQDIIKGLTPTLEMIASNKQLDIELLGQPENRNRSSQRRSQQRRKRHNSPVSSQDDSSPARTLSIKRHRSDHPSTSEMESPDRDTTRMRSVNNPEMDSDSSASENDYDSNSWKNCIKLIKNAFPEHFTTSPDTNTNKQTANIPLGLQSLGRKASSSENSNGLPIGPSVQQNFTAMNQEIYNKRNTNDGNFLLRPKRSFTSLKDDEHFYKKCILNNTIKELVPPTMKLSELSNSTNFKLPAKHHKLLEESAKAPLRYLSHTEWLLGATGKIVAEKFPDNEDLINLLSTASTMVNKATRDTVSNITNVILTQRDRISSKFRRSDAESLRNLPIDTTYLYPEPQLKTICEGSDRSKTSKALQDLASNWKKPKNDNNNYSAKNSYNRNNNRGNYHNNNNRGNYNNNRGNHNNRGNYNNDRASTSTKDNNNKQKKRK
ncbi:unnamed protein product [Owenia fusiformis]|uniref:Uncharacterized protein n=1 Tax=Owenia fusiformis TaxID=6347 RepID=A0A8S4NWB2_OWEFU|nr:unnamed protein product [Owenia fusiformis]